MPLHKFVLEAQNPLWDGRGNIVRLMVFLLDTEFGGVSTSSPATLSLALRTPLGVSLAPVTLAAGDVVAGSGALGTTTTPVGSWFYDMDTSLANWALAGHWQGTWTSTAPTASVTFGFQVLSTDGSV